MYKRQRQPLPRGVLLPTPNSDSNDVRQAPVKALANPGTPRFPLLPPSPWLAALALPVVLPLARVVADPLGLAAAVEAAGQLQRWPLGRQGPGNQVKGLASPQTNAQPCRQRGPSGIPGQTC